VKRANVWTSPTWKSVSSDEMAWRVSCWQIDSPSGTFWARRNHCTASEVDVYDVNLPAASSVMTEEV
jgi:hypothetical protein